MSSHGNIYDTVEQLLFLLINASEKTIGINQVLSLQCSCTLMKHCSFTFNRLHDRRLSHVRLIKKCCHRSIVILFHQKLRVLMSSVRVLTSFLSIGLCFLSLSLALPVSFAGKRTCHTQREKERRICFSLCK